MSDSELGEKTRERFLKLRQVEVFLEAARRENFGAAAAELGISTAALSQAVTDLERNLGGVKLFERDQSGAALTNAGQLLVAYGASLLRAESAARQAVATAGALPEKKPRRLRVACEPDLVDIVTETVGDLLRLHYLSVELIEADTQAIIRLVEEQKVTVGVGYGLLDTHEGVTAKALTPAPLRLVVNHRHPLRNAARVVLKSLQNEPFALPWTEDHTAPGAQHLRHLVEDYFQKNSFTPGYMAFRAPSTSSVLALVRAAGAVTLSTSFDIVNDPRLSILTLDPPPAAATVSMFHRKDDNKPTGPTRLFIANAMRLMRDDQRAPSKHRRKWATQIE